MLGFEGDKLSTRKVRILSLVSRIVTMAILIVVIIIKINLPFFCDGVRIAYGLGFSEMSGVLLINVVFSVTLIIITCTCLIVLRTEVCVFCRILCLIIMVVLELLYMRDPAEFHIGETTKWFWLSIMLYLVGIIINSAYIVFGFRKKSIHNIFGKS